jgi:hypothetical protein
MIIVSYDENDHPTGAVEISKKEIVGYGYLASILRYIKSNKAYETSFYNFTIENANEWYNTMPSYLNNEYNQFKVESEMPSAVLNLSNVKLKR